MTQEYPFESLLRQNEEIRKLLNQHMGITATASSPLYPHPTLLMEYLQFAQRQADVINYFDGFMWFLDTTQKFRGAHDGTVSNFAMEDWVLSQISTFEERITALENGVEEAVQLLGQILSELVLLRTGMIAAETAEDTEDEVTVEDGD